MDKENVLKGLAKCAEFLCDECPYQIYDHNPSPTNNFYYKTALQNFQDFCVAYVAYLVGDEEYGSKNPCEEETVV